EVTDLLGRVHQRAVLGQDFAGDLGEHLDVRVDHRGPEVFRCGKLGDIQFLVAADEDDAAQKAGTDVVRVPGAVRRGLPGHGEGKKLLLGKRLADQVIHREGTGHRGGGGGAET